MPLTWKRLFIACNGETVPIAHDQSEVDPDFQEGIHCMNHQEKWTTVRRVAWAFVALFMTGACSFDFQESEFQCEQAMARLEKCCPGFDPAQYSCIDDSGAQGCGAGSEPELPDLTLEESQRITEATCAELVDTAICKRATNPAAAEEHVQATANLDECCSSLFCTTSTFGWFSSTICDYPNLSHDEALCITASSCTQLINDGICARAADMTALESYCQ